MGPTPSRAAEPQVESDQVDWSIAEQILDVLRSPATWYETISENIRLDDNHMHRDVTIKVSTAAQTADDRSSNDFYAVLLKPRRGVLSSLTLDGESAVGGGRLFSHREHVQFARLLITFRFMSIVRLVADVDSLAALDFVETFPDTLNRLLAIPDISEPSLALRVVHDEFEADGALKALARVASNDEISEFVRRLHLLCVELSERYYKIVKMRLFTEGNALIKYSYGQILSDRSDGSVLTRLFQRLFRAPTSVFLIHVPLARMTDHYEFRMSQFRDRYVLWQRVLHQPDASSSQVAELSEIEVAHEHGSEEGARDNEAPDSPPRRPWVSRAPGRVFAPHVFIGDGDASDKGLFVGVRFEEIPPGSSATALIAQLPSAVIGTALVWWSLTHASGISTAAAGILATLLAIRNTLADERISRGSSEIVNAPAMPRALLLLQSALMIVLTLWLLIRGTVDGLLHMPDIGALRSFDRAVTSIDPYIGGMVILGSVAISVALLRRAARAQAVFERNMRFAESRLANRSSRGA